MGSLDSLFSGGCGLQGLHSILVFLFTSLALTPMLSIFKLLARALADKVDLRPLAGIDCPWTGKSCFGNSALVEAIFEASKCL